MLKKSKKKFPENLDFASTTKEAFNSLKRVFFVALILLHFDFKRKINMETNVSKFEIFNIVNQLIEFID